MPPRRTSRTLWILAGATLAAFLGGAHAGMPALLHADDARPPAPAPAPGAPGGAPGAPAAPAPVPAPASKPASDAIAERERAREALKKDLAQDVARLESFSRAFRAVAKLASPSVVHIRVTKEVAPGADPSQDPALREQLRRFFGLPEDEETAPRGRARRSPVQQGEGSGVVYSPDGYILTNNHVVFGADRIEVRLEDGRELPAKVVGADAKIDLAVIKVEARDLIPLEMALAGSIEVGDWVIAVGNPFGLQHTVTAGIVSGTHRAGVGITDYESFIQTDAAINPGNSGGPLVDLHGRLVGINTAIASRTGGFMGVGFAIPVEMVRSYAPQLIEHGRVRRGWLGVSIQSVDADLAARFRLPEAKGALVGGVLEGGPAAEAGLRTADVIVSIEGAPIDSPNALRNRVASIQPGVRIQVGYVRDGKRAETSILLGELEDEAAQTAAAPERPARPGVPGAPRADTIEEGERLGFSVRALTPAIARRLGLAADRRGVVVDVIEPGSAAQAAGFQRGDVIEEVDRKPTPDLDSFDRAMREGDSASGLLFLVRRGDATSFARIKVR